MTAAMLRQNHETRKVHIPKATFHISDSEGNSKDFYVKQRDKEIMFTKEDVEKILEAALMIVVDSIRRGEPVNIRGFGELTLHYRKARYSKHIRTGEDTYVPEMYVAKFYPGIQLKTSAKIYTANQAELKNDKRVRPDDIITDDDTDAEDDA